MLTYHVKVTCGVKVSWLTGLDENDQYRLRE